MHFFIHFKNENSALCNSNILTRPPDARNFFPLMKALFPCLATVKNAAFADRCRSFGRLSNCQAKRGRRECLEDVCWF
jgi:hypothetical protein